MNDQISHDWTGHHALQDINRQKRSDEQNDKHEQIDFRKTEHGSEYLVDLFENRYACDGIQKRCGNSQKDNRQDKENQKRNHIVISAFKASVYKRQRSLAARKVGRRNPAEQAQGRRNRLRPQRSLR